MRIAIDLRWMIPGQAGGLENEARSFLDQLLALDETNTYQLILPRSARDSVDPRGRGNFQVVLVDRARTALRRRLSSAAAALEASLPWGTRAPWRPFRWLNADVVYSLQGILHTDLIHLKHLLKVPDIQHEYYPEYFEPHVLRLRRQLYREATRVAKHIATGSEFSRKTLIEKLGVAPEKITVVSLAADPRFVPAGDSEADLIVYRKCSLEKGGYLLFPAHGWRHKNHRAAITALSILRQRHGLGLTLALTGGYGNMRPELEELAIRLGLQHQVRFLGYCPADDMPAIYRGAACLVFPSLFEGFGMPPLEAMASGCPVVASNAASLPEVAGDAALLVDPLNHEELAEALHTVIANQDLRRELKRKGFEQAARFNWRRYSVETLNLIARVHRSRPLAILPPHGI